MPYAFRFDRVANLALVTLTGRVEGRDLHRACVDLLAHPRWVAGMNVIWDGRALRELVLMPGELERHACFKAEHREALGEARDLLVFDKAFHQVAAELYVVLARLKGREAHVFGSMDEALQALGHERVPAGLLPHPEAL